VTIERPQARNAVDLATARVLFDAFKGFVADPGADVAVLTGAGGAFCADADLEALAAHEPGRFEKDRDFGRWGPLASSFGKPVIATGGRRRNGACALVRPEDRVGDRAMDLGEAAAACEIDRGLATIASGEPAEGRSRRGVVNRSTESFTTKDTETRSPKACAPVAEAAWTAIGRPAAGAPHPRRRHRRAAPRLVAQASSGEPATSRFRI